MNNEQNKIPKIPTASAEKIIRYAGRSYDMRVSATASDELATIISEIAYDIAKESITVTRHAGRSTVKKEDIIFALDIITNKKSL